jgi:hypothetical protein
MAENAYLKKRIAAGASFNGPELVYSLMGKVQAGGVKIDQKSISSPS